MRTLVAVLLFAAPIFADGMVPKTMEVGKVGKLWPDGEGMVGAREVVKYTIAQVGDDWLALRVSGHGEGADLFIVRAVPTKGLVDDRRWKPTGEWKVTGTEKYRGKTVFTLQPHPKD